MEEQCFAWKMNKDGYFECSALEKVKCNGCNKECRFYKTMEQYVYDNAKVNKDKIESFNLIIDGRKHGEFTDITSMDDYLKRYYQFNRIEEDTKAPKEWQGDYGAVFFNHNIIFAHRRY